MSDEHGTQEETGNAIKTSVSLPPYLNDWLTELVKTKRFNSKSGAMTCALAEMKGRMEEQNKQENEPAKTYGQSEDDLIYVFLKLLSNHRELIGEFNDLRRKEQTDTTRIVNF